MADEGQQEGENQEQQVEEYHEEQPQGEQPHMLFLKEAMPKPSHPCAGLVPNADPQSICDQAVHSITEKKIIVALVDNPFIKMSIRMVSHSRITDLRHQLGSDLAVNPNDLVFWFKAGMYWRKALEENEISHHMYVKGVDKLGTVTIAPPLERSKWMPGFEQLPIEKKIALGGKAPAKKPKMRLFMFYGPGDAFKKDWCDYNFVAPEWMDWVVYEWPGHGDRDGEPMPKNLDAVIEDAIQGLGATLEQHAPGGVADRALLTFLGHGVGVDVMMGVAKAMDTKHQVKVGSAFILDRPAPKSGMFSDHGLELMQNDPNAFMNEWFMTPDDPKKELFGMFCELQNRYLPSDENSYKFDCTLNVYRASQHWTQAGEDEKVSLMLPKDSFDDWKMATTKTVNMKTVNSDYFGMRVNGEVINELFAKCTDDLSARGLM